MAKKKSKRQHKPKKTDKGPDVVDSEKDADANGSEGATELPSLEIDDAETEANNDLGETRPKKCPHMKGSVRFTRLQKTVPTILGKGLPGCAACKSDHQRAKDTAKAQNLNGVDVPVPQLPTASSLWLCLHCFEISCGRYDAGHAVSHYDSKQHDIVINLETFSCWCYACDQELVPTATQNQLIADCQRAVQKVLKPNVSVNDISVRKTSKQADRSKKAPPPIPGLVNLGNTCFFNSLIQSLSATQYLRKYMDPQFSAPPPVIPPSQGPLTKAFFNVLSRLHTSPAKVQDPSELFSRISAKWKEYKRMGQQDSHELMRRLLDAVKLETCEKDEKGIAKKGQVTWVDDVFAGKLVSVIVCHTCCHISYSPEEFMDISVPVVGAKEKKSIFSFGQPQRKPKPASVLPPCLEALDSADISDSVASISLTDEQSKPGNKKTLILDLLRSVSVEGRLDPKAPVDIGRCLAEFLDVEIIEDYNCDNCNKRPKVESPASDTKEGESVDANKAGADTGPHSSSSADGNDVQETKEEDSVQEIPAVLEKEESNSQLGVGDQSERSDKDVDGTVTGGSEIETSDDADTSVVSDRSSTSSPNPEDQQVDALGNTITPEAAIPTKEVPTKEVEKKDEKPAILSPASKRYLIHTVPRTLVVHLKRFQSGSFGGRTRKVDDAVLFEETIDVRRFLVPGEEAPASTVYRLVAVVVHMGGLFGGHYVAYVRLGVDSEKVDGEDFANQGGWAYCSDTATRACGWEEVQRSQAYILFYERIGQ